MGTRLRSGILCTVLAGALVGAASAPADAAGPPVPRVLHVGEIAHQDIAPQPGSEPDTLVEPDVAVSPLDPRIAVAAAHDGRFPDGGAVTITHAWTRDGGRTWHHAPVPGLTTAAGGRWPRASDPVVAFGPDGTAYLSTLLVEIPGCASAVAVSRSDDGGRTFGAPVLVHSSATCAYSDDKNWLVVDTWPHSPHRGRLYQFWTAFLSDASGTVTGAPQVLRWSDDRGSTWSRTVAVTPSTDGSQGSQPMIQPDGTVTDAYLDYGSAGFPESERTGGQQGRGGLEAEAAGTALLARTSRDGGATWSGPVTVTTDVGPGPEGIRCCLPSATADGSTGRLYAAWDSVQPELVLLSTSTDGRHWSAPVQVNRDARAGRAHVNVDVAAHGGRVFVSYGTRDAGSSGGQYIQQRISSSYDAGAHFGPGIAVAPPSDTRYAAMAGGIFPGDYIGTAAAAGRVYAVWCRSSPPPSSSATYHQTLYAAVLRP
jgi:hypothetical protein